MHAPLACSRGTDQAAVKAACDDMGVALIAYSPLALGGRPAERVLLPTPLLPACFQVSATSRACGFYQTAVHTPTPTHHVRGAIAPGRGPLCALGPLLRCRTGSPAHGRHPCGRQGLQPARPSCALFGQPRSTPVNPVQILAGMLTGKYSMDDPSSLPGGPRGLLFRQARHRCALPWTPAARPRCCRAMQLPPVLSRQRGPRVHLCPPACRQVPCR